MYSGNQVHQLDLGLLKYEVLKKLWVQITVDSDGYPTTPSFTKYEETRLTRKINEAYNRIAATTRAIRGWFIIPLKATYTQYPLPPNVVGIIPPVYYFTAATEYTELEVLDRSLLNKRLPGWRGSMGEPQYCYVGDWSVSGRKLGVAPTPTTDATAVTLGTGVSSSTNPTYIAQGIRGKAAAGGDANTYIDSEGRNLSLLGAAIGLIVRNVTDNSYMTITGISTTSATNDTLTATGGLAGGADNVWTLNDKMEIPAGDYGGYHQIGDDVAKYLVSFAGGGLPAPGVTMAAGNLLVETYILPVPLSRNDDIPSIHPLAHPILVLEAAAALALEEPITSPEFAQGQAYVAATDKGIAEISGFLASQFNQEDMQLQGGK